MTEYADMTDEEYDALDEELTRTIPKLGPNRTGFISQRQMMHSLGFTNITINYLMTKAAVDHKSPAQIIHELVAQKLAETPMI